MSDLIAAPASSRTSDLLSSSWSFATLSDGGEVPAQAPIEPCFEFCFSLLERRELGSQGRGSDAFFNRFDDRADLPIDSSELLLVSDVGALKRSVEPVELDSYNEAPRRSLGEVNGACVPAWLSVTDEFEDIQTQWLSF